MRIRWWHWYGAGVILGIGAIIGVANSDGSGSSAMAAQPQQVAPVEATATPTDVHADQAGYHYPASVEMIFQRNFADSPGMGTCALAATERRYSYNDFVSVSHAYGGTGELPPSLKAIVLTCALQLQ